MPNTIQNTMIVKTDIRTGKNGWYTGTTNP
jgi:hypothetical protein